MKKLILTIALIGTIVFKIDAQTPSIPNGNFENWTTSTFENPQNYIWTSNIDAFRNGTPFNIIKSNDAYHGNFAVRMTTEIANGDTVPGIFVNVDPKSDNPANWHGGFAYDQQATGMRGYYKSSINSPDTGFVMAFFYKSGTMIGMYGFYFYGTHNDYTPFSFDFNPALPTAPDTIIFGAGSSNFANMANMRNGSMLMLDSISFTGVNSQPALMNGDFELWQTTTIDKPADWFLQRGGEENLTGGVSKSTDAKAGNYAIELTTYVGERNNTNIAQPGQISTGWYYDNCNSNCYEQGGFPFTNQIDTLAFWYKYSPQGGATAGVNLTFKKNGNYINNTGTILSSSATYQYVEIPFNNGQIPDSVIVDLYSSMWQDSSLTHIGSSLKIDEIHFKSQPLSTGIFNSQINNTIRVFPNPSSEKITLNYTECSGQQIELTMFNALGQKVYSNKSLDKSGITTLDVSKFEDGIYFLHMTSNNKTIYTKEIIIGK